MMVDLVILQCVDDTVIQEIPKKKLQVDNDVFEKRVKSQLRKSHILGYAKMTTCATFWMFKNLHCSLLKMTIFFIFCSLKFVLYLFEILHVCRTHHSVEQDTYVVGSTPTTQKVVIYA